MRRRLTRRAVTKILLATPAAFAAGPLACQTAGGTAARTSERLSPAEQKERADLARSVSLLKESVGKLDQMEIPVGSEPSFFFTPLLPKK
jgi:ATP-dependent exoDNAse (exonuclease V) alpha subunit